MKKKTDTGINQKKSDALPSDDIDNNITEVERDLLDSAGEDDEERELHEAELDNTDDDGELLNENSTGDINSGDELDVPGSDEDDYDEALGEEDEENNLYSIGGEKKD